MTQRPLLSESQWARDFAIVGLAVGALAPYGVIFDPDFSLLSGLAGGASGALVGAWSAWVLERLRGRLPLAMVVPMMALLGGLWGAFSGACGGMASLRFGADAVPLGMVMGGATGMLTVGVGFLPYLVLAVRGRTTLPIVALGLLASPLLGWAGLSALGALGMGMWLVALPVVALAAVALDRGERAARQQVTTAKATAPGDARVATPPRRSAWRAPRAEGIVESR